jgi:hypothetical protein
MSVMVSLTGGLGNQLFQLAAGLYYSEKSNLKIITDLGVPRVSRNGLPELFSFNLPEEIIIAKKSRIPLLFRKMNGYLLFRGISDVVRFKFKVVDSIVSAICISLLSLKLKIPLSIYVGKDVGFSEINPISRKFLLIGYFQSFRWAEADQVKARLMTLSPKTKSQEFEYFKTLAIHEKPIVVHIRLTDYLDHPHFGIMDTDYYRRAINWIKQSHDIRSIWVFSDSIEGAREIFPLEFSDNVRWITEIGDSTSQTFEIMRHGAGYIIANSTFSWWAAFLRYNQVSPVICPGTWFKDAKEPSQLIPDSWIRLKSISNSDWSNK